MAPAIRYRYAPVGVVNAVDLALELLQPISRARDYLVLARAFDARGEDLELTECTWGMSTIFGRRFSYVGSHPDVDSKTLVRLPTFRCNAYFSSLVFTLGAFVAESPDVRRTFGRAFVGEGFGEDPGGFWMPQLRAVTGEVEEP